MTDLRPPRHLIVRPTLPLWQRLVLIAVAALIGLWLALGHS